MARRRRKSKGGDSLVMFFAVFLAVLLLALILIVLQVSRTRKEKKDSFSAGITDSMQSAVITPTASPVRDGDVIKGTYYDPNTDSLDPNEFMVTPVTESRSSDGDVTGEAQQTEASSTQSAPAAESEASAPEVTVYVTSTGVNVRSAPSTEGSTVLGQLTSGTSLSRVGEEGDWSRVIYNGQTAYIKSEFLSTELLAKTNWNLDELDNDSAGFGYSSDHLDENMVPMDWEWYESKWGQFNVDWIQDTSKKTIYLTMDEGFGNDNTIRILDTLGEKGVNVTFFVTQNFVDERPELVQRMIDEGHQIGNHTCTHPNLPSLSIDEAKEQILKLQQIVEEKFGYTMRLFRFPEGEYSSRTLGLVNNLGLKAVFWSYAYVDYDESNQPDVGESLEKALSRLHPGAIYLLHASSDTNEAMLADFIDGARERGFEFGIYPLS